MLKWATAGLLLRGEDLVGSVGVARFELHACQVVGVARGPWCKLQCLFQGLGCPRVITQLVECQAKVVVQTRIGWILSRCPLKVFSRLLVVSLAEMQPGNAGQGRGVVGFAFQGLGVALHRLAEVAGRFP